MWPMHCTYPQNPRHWTLFFNMLTWCSVYTNSVDRFRSVGSCRTENGIAYTARRGAMHCGMIFRQTIKVAHKAGNVVSSFIQCGPYCPKIPHLVGLGWGIVIPCRTLNELLKQSIYKSEHLSRMSIVLWRIVYVVRPDLGSFTRVQIAEAMKS